MKRYELENGMYVKLRDESVCIVQCEEDLLVDVKDATYVKLSNYNNDFTYMNNNNDLDIVVVYYNYKMDVILWEETKPFLTLEEEEYLKAVIKPFKDMVKYVLKYASCIGGYYIEIVLERDSNIKLPYINNMSLKFEGLKLCIKYTLKELGLDD